MAIWNLGSINADYIYEVPHLVAPGETLAAKSRHVFLGGKGANMSVAAARAGAKVSHIGAVGTDGGWAIDRLRNYGVSADAIVQSDNETGHALIFVADDGENNIVLCSGANRTQDSNDVQNALKNAQAGDWFVTQNEVNLQEEAAAFARQIGLRTAYAAAPFDAEITQKMLPLLDFLILNEIEAEQLQQATGLSPQRLPVENVIVTQGAKGATWFGATETGFVPSQKVDPIDTTGAGDTFTGYVLAGLDQGRPILNAMEWATYAAALMVTRKGTADVIPSAEDVAAFMG